jgi:hypothetical protein
MPATIAASALFTVGIIAFVHAGATILRGLRRTHARRRDEDEPAVRARWMPASRRVTLFG